MNTPAPRECEIPECSLSRYHEGMHEDIDGRVVGPCAARRPGYDTGPVWGRRTLPCVLPRDHDGPHRNAFQEPWNSTDVPDHPHHVAAREAARARVGTDTSTDDHEDASTDEPASTDASTGTDTEPPRIAARTRKGRR